MRPPSEKRKTPLVEGGAFQKDSATSRFEQTEHNADSQFHQGKNSPFRVAVPVATAAMALGQLVAL